MSNIEYSVGEGIAKIRLNRPDRLNALDREAMIQLFTVWEAFENDESALVAIITGAGDRAFSVGRDLKEPEIGPFNLKSIPLIGSTVSVTKPTIAAVNGLALGGGFLFAQMCDLCIAAEHATFSIPEAKLGRGAAWAASLSSLLPPRVVMEMLTTGTPVTAQRMYSLGFVNSIVAARDLEKTAHAMASEIVANAPLSVRACRTMVRTSYASLHASMSETEADALFKPVYDSADAAEGARAFQERRKPVWKGR